MSRYGLPPGYRSQLPASYAPSPGGPVWQPDVIPLAAELAAQLGSRRLIDVGCSTAAKLLPFADRFELIGLDLPGQLPDDERGRWIPADLDRAEALPLSAADLDGAVLICSDVIEHLAEPEHLAHALLLALGIADALVLSTPDRARVRGPEDLGPPRNPCHAREWTAAELCAWLSTEGFSIASQTWQRSNDRATARDTIVVVVGGARRLSS